MIERNRPGSEMPQTASAAGWQKYRRAHGPDRVPRADLRGLHDGANTAVFEGRIVKDTGGGALIELANVVNATRYLWREGHSRRPAFRRHSASLARSPGRRS